MFGYNLKPWELFGYPLLAVFISLGITNAIPEGWVRDLAKLGYIAICINSAFIGSFYLYHEAAKFIDARTPDTKEERPTVADVSAIPKSKDNIYSQGVSKIRFDARRNFARVILGQWEQTQTIDATETSWLKPRVNSVDPRRKLPKLWQGKDTEFRECKKQMEQDGILGRENPANDKSRFIVRDEVGLREIVAGRR